MKKLFVWLCWKIGGHVLEYETTTVYYNYAAGLPLTVERTESLRCKFCGTYLRDRVTYRGPANFFGTADR